MRCPTCNSTSPRECWRVNNPNGWEPHPHGGEPTACCPDPFHDEATADRVAELVDVLLSIRGLCLGLGPHKSRKIVAAINELVGYGVYGDFAESKWVRRHIEREL